MEIWQKDLLEVLRDIIQRIPGSYIYDIDRSKVVKQIDLWREQVGNVAKPDSAQPLLADAAVRLKVISSLERLHSLLSSGTTFDFDNEWDIKEGEELKEFIDSIKSSFS